MIINQCEQDYLDMLVNKNVVEGKNDDNLIFKLYERTSQIFLTSVIFLILEISF